MSDPLIRACDHYVVLEPGQKEKILNVKETLAWLEKWLKDFDHLPMDLKQEQPISSTCQHLLDTACELEINPGFKIQWFAVRLDRY